VGFQVVEFPDLGFRYRLSEGASSLVALSDKPQRLVVEDLRLPVGDGLFIPQATVGLAPFSIEGANDFSLATSRIDLLSQAIEYGIPGTSSHATLTTSGALKLVFARPLELVASPGTEGVVEFSIEGSLELLEVSTPLIDRLALSGVKVSAQADRAGLVGRIQLDAKASGLNNVKVAKLVESGSIRVDDLQFSLTRSGSFGIDRLALEVSVHESAIVDAIKSALSTPIPPSESGVPGRDLTRWITGFTVRDTRIRTSVNGVNLASFSLGKNIAQATIGGVVRVDLEAEVLTTRMVNRVISTRRPCIRENRYGIPVPTTCNDPISTKVPETHHKWKSVAAGTVKAGLGVTVSFETSVGSPLGELRISPRITRASVDVKDVPGFVDKGFLTPFVHRFITREKLDAIPVFEKLDADSKALLNRLKLEHMEVRPEKGRILVTVIAGR
jgi:hypothetical protein